MGRAFGVQFWAAMVMVVTGVHILPANSYNHNLKYFSIWNTGAGAVEYPGDEMNSSFINFFFDIDRPELFQALADQGYGPSLLHVRTVLFYPRHDTRKGLRPDYAQRWNATLEALLPLIKKRLAMGVFLGDELCWDCVGWNDLKAAADLVRGTLPKSAVIYYNEAFPPLDDVGMWNASCGPKIALEQGYPHVPKSIDWVSIDYYPNEGTFEGAQRIYREKIFPKMNQEQRVLFVPPAFSCSKGSSAGFVDRFCCSKNNRDGANPDCKGSCENAMKDWAIKSYNWARTDDRFVGLNPWYWQQKNTKVQPTYPKNHSDVPGLRWMNETRVLYEKIGMEIVTGNLRELSLD